MSFLIPNFSPKTITDLTSQAEVEPALAEKEAELKAQFAAIRAHIKDSAPLGVQRQHERGPDEQPERGIGGASMTGTESDRSQEGGLEDEEES